MRLAVSTSTPRVTAGEPLILRCEVQGTTGPVSLQWWHLPPQRPGHRVLVATMERDGSLSLGSAYQDGRARGSLRLQKESSGTFTLVIPSTLEDDGGQYRCEATQWSRGRSWTGKGEAAVTVSSMGEFSHPCFWAGGSAGEVGGHTSGTQARCALSSAAGRPRADHLALQCFSFPISTRMPESSMVCFGREQ